MIVSKLYRIVELAHNDRYLDTYPDAFNTFPSNWFFYVSPHYKYQGTFYLKPSDKLLMSLLGLTYHLNLTTRPIVILMPGVKLLRVFPQCLNLITTEQRDIVENRHFSSLVEYIDWTAQPTQLDLTQ